MTEAERRGLGLVSSTTWPVFESDMDARCDLDDARDNQACAYCKTVLPSDRGPRGFTMATFCCDEHARKFHKRVARLREQEFRRRIAELGF